MKRRLVMHVGLPKTGTTALQRWCYSNREWLRERGVDYPDRIHHPLDPKHQFLVQDLRTGNLDRFVTELDGSPCRTVLLSSEGLTNHLFDVSGGAADEFRRATHGWNVEVVVIFREPTSWAKSLWKQHLVNPAGSAPRTVALWRRELGESMSELAAWTGARLGNERSSHPIPGATTLTADEFAALARIRFLQDRGLVAAAVRRLYGATRVVEGDFDEGWPAVLGGALGIELPDDSGAERCRVSVSDELAELLRRVNGLDLPSDLRLRVFRGLASGTDPNSSIRVALEVHALFPPGAEAIGVLCDDVMSWAESALSADDTRVRTVGELCEYLRQ